MNKISPTPIIIWTCYIVCWCMCLYYQRSMYPSSSDGFMALMLVGSILCVIITGVCAAAFFHPKEFDEGVDRFTKGG